MGQFPSVGRVNFRAARPLGLTLTALALTPRPAYAFICGHDLFDDQFTFYSDATHTTVVGHCENDCGTCTCWGTQTSYYTVVSSRIC